MDTTGNNLSFANAPTNGSQTNEQKIIALLEEQNKTLRMTHEILVKAMYQTGSKKSIIYHFRTGLSGVEMSIGDMIGLMIQWFIASIPVGIVCGIVIGILYLIFGATLVTLFR